MPWAGECGLVLQQRFGLISVTEARLCSGMPLVFLPKYQQLATLVPRSYLLEIANVPSEAQVPVSRHVHGDLRAIPMTEMPTVVVTHG